MLLTWKGNNYKDNNGSYFLIFSNCCLFLKEKSDRFMQKHCIPRTIPLSSLSYFIFHLSESKVLGYKNDLYDFLKILCCQNFVTTQDESMHYLND